MTNLTLIYNNVYYILIVLHIKFLTLLVKKQTTIYIQQLFFNYEIEFQEVFEIFSLLCKNFNQNTSFNFDIYTSKHKKIGSN